MSTSPTYMRPAGTADPVGPPGCIVITGPQGAGKTRWLQNWVRLARSGRPTLRLAWLLAEQGRTRVENFCRESPGIALRKIVPTCTCCPGAVDLPGHALALTENGQTDWLLIELPVLSAPGLLAEFDRLLHWPRKLVTCLTPAWSRDYQTGEMSPFQSALFAKATMLVTNPAEAQAVLDRCSPTSPLC